MTDAEIRDVRDVSLPFSIFIFRCQSDKLFVIISGAGPWFDNDTSLEDLGLQCRYRWQSGSWSRLGGWWRCEKGILQLGLLIFERPYADIACGGEITCPSFSPPPYSFLEKNTILLNRMRSDHSSRCRPTKLKKRFSKSWNDLAASKIKFCPFYFPRVAPF